MSNAEILEFIKDQLDEITWMESRRQYARTPADYWRGKRDGLNLVKIYLEKYGEVKNDE